MKLIEWRKQRDYLSAGIHIFFYQTRTPKAAAHDVMKGNLKYDCTYAVVIEFLFLLVPGSHVSQWPTLNYIIYLPKKNESPLHIVEKKGMYRNNSKGIFVVIFL